MSSRKGSFFPVKFLQDSVNSAENVHKQFVLAVVDEESDLTFYEVKTAVPKGEMPEPYPAVKTDATFLEDRVITWDSQASETLYIRGFYGKMLDSERLQLSLVESLYLFSEGIITIRDRNGKVFSFDEFVEKALKIESSFLRKYSVYKNLRDSGHVVKTGFKFGTHFRVYKKIESIEKIPHSEYLVNAIPADFEFRLPVMSGAVRLANSVRKTMLFAIEKGDRGRISGYRQSQNVILEVFFRLFSFTLFIKSDLQPRVTICGILLQWISLAGTGLKEVITWSVRQ